MNFVLDPSVALAFALEDEASPQTDAILDLLGTGQQAIVPALWRWEIGNALLMAARRKRITPEEIHQHLTRLSGLPIQPDDTAWQEAWSATLLLAQQHKLTLYDASYLEIALRHGIPLATQDAELRKAATANEVTLLPE